MSKEMKTENVTVYSPDRILKIGLVAAWRELFLSLIRSRELIWRLFLRDFSAKYRQSLLGVLWAVLNPLITVGIFVFLNKSGVFNIGSIDVPYPAFALVGLTVWALFATGLTVSSNSIVAAGAMVTKINFPKSSLVIASMGQAVVEFMVRLCLTIIVFVIYGIVPAWTAVLLPLAAIPVFLLTLGMGFFLALLTGIFRDTVHVVVLFTTFLLFLVPVLYPIPDSGLFAAVNAFNPLSHLIVGFRDLVFLGKLSSPAGYFGSCLFSLVVFLFFWRFFQIVEPKIAERV